jgi:hypothetical protein
MTEEPYRSEEALAEGLKPPVPAKLVVDDRAGDNDTGRRPFAARGAPARGP